MLYSDGLCIVVGHYTDIHSITNTGRGAARSSGDDGHHSDIHSISAGHRGALGRRDSIGHYQRIDYDRVNTNSADVVDTGVNIRDVRRGRDYEELDPSVIATLRQTSSISHHYSALATVAAAAAESTQQTDAEVMEVSQFNDGNNLQRTVSQQLCISFLMAM